MRKIIQADSGNVDRLFQVASRVSKNSPEFVLEAVKACLIEGHPEVANRLWQLEKIDQLPESLSNNVKKLSNRELMPIKEFFLAKMGGYDTESTNHIKGNESNTEILAKLYNSLIENSMSRTAQENPCDLVNEALSKWVPLDR